MAILTKLSEEKTVGGLALSDMLSSGLNEFFIQSGALQVEYFLEEVSGRTKTLVAMPAQPQQVVVRRVYSENPVYTFDSEFAYREVANPRIIEVQLTGQTGKHLRISTDENGKPTYTEGPEHLHNFEKFLDKYHFHAASHTTPVVYSIQSVQNDLDYENRPYLVFRGVKENIHGRCHVVDFSYSRSVETHRLGSYQWSLSLRIYDTAEAKDPTRFEMMQSLDKATRSINALTGLSEFFQRGFQASLGQISGGAITVLNSVSGLATSIGRIDNTVYGSLNTITSVVSAGIKALDSIGALFDGDAYVRQNEQFVRDSTRAVVDNWSRMKFCEDVVRKNFRDSTDQWKKAPGTPVLETQRRRLVTKEILYQTWLILGAMGRDGGNGSASDIYGFLAREYGHSALALMFSEREYTPGASVKTEQYSIGYELRPGQSLLTIANSFLGDPSRWIELSRLNDAQDAYTKNDGSPFQAGDLILVPTQAGEFLNTEGDITRDSDLDSVIGTDIRFKDGDIFLSFDDLEMVDGLDNLKQTIERYLQTSTEEVTMDPKYGARQAIIGSKINTITSSLIATRVRESLLRDRRILDVTNMLVSVDPNSSVTLNMSLTCVCVGQNDIVVNTSIPTG